MQLSVSIVVSSVGSTLMNGASKMTIDWVIRDDLHNFLCNKQNSKSKRNQHKVKHFYYNL